MITAASYVSSKQIAGMTYDVVVSITDDAATPPTFQRHLTVTGRTQAQLRDALSRAIAELNDETSVKNVLAGLAPGTSIPVTAPALPAKTQEEINRDDFRLKYRTLTALKRGQAAGLTIQAALVTSTTSAAQTAWNLAPTNGSTWLVDL